MKRVQNTLVAALLWVGHVFAAEQFAVSDPFMAEFEGFWSATTGARGRVIAQVRPVGNNEYDGFILLTRAKSPVTAFHLKASTADGSTLKFSGKTASPAGGDLLAQNEISGEIRDGKLRGKFSGELGEGTLEGSKTTRKSRTLGARPPRNSVVLVNESKAEGWENLTWEMKDGALEVGKGNISARARMGSFKLHLEFRTPFMPEKKGQERGNSGVYLQGKYEVQVLDSFGIYPLQDNDCGGIYRVKAPAVNACFPPGEWQTYDITYAEGNASRPPRITVQLNGTTVIDRAEVPSNLVAGGTGGGQSQAGFLMLQDHGNPVQFRNIWAQPIFSAQKLR